MAIELDYNKIPKNIDKSKLIEIVYKGVKYRFHNYMMGTGLWTDTRYGNKVAPKELQPILNKLVFGKTNIDSLNQILKMTNVEKRQELRRAIGFLQLQVKGIQSNSSNIPGTLATTKNRQFLPGGMYFFKYQAKHAMTLEYWDALPLIILLEMKGNRFYGINFHYLNLNMRIALMQKLLPLVYNPDDIRLRLKISYEILKLSSFKEWKVCFHSYLIDHVKSRIIPIDSIDTGIALFLPVDSFQKKSKQYVWKDSIQKLKK